MAKKVKRKVNSTTNNPQKTNSIDELPPLMKAFFKMGDMYGYGKDSFPFQWSQLILIVQFSYYFLLKLDSGLFNWICLGLSILAITLLIGIIRYLAKDFITEINPFDFVTQELLTFASLIVHYGIMNYAIYTIDSSLYSYDHVPNVINFIYNSFATVGTIGFYDLFPATVLTKLLVIVELCISLWFLTTMVPLAMSLQSERIKSFTVAKREFEDELHKAEREGTISKVSDTDDFTYNGIKMELPKSYRRMKLIRKMFTTRP